MQITDELAGPVTLSAGAPQVTAEPEPGYPLDDVVDHVRKSLHSGMPDLYRVVFEEVQRQVFREVLNHSGGHQQRASEKLGICRMTLRTKLRSLGMMNGKRRLSREMFREPRNR